ncbi:MAG TPA: HNH endonuclease signature motif containing protein [Bryobacteraceae bacterium]|nr:HNH endonuclease signature motif containing protein [Bryobacteraceae bacterium]
MTWSEAVRELVRSRALGRCEYCLLDPSDAGLPHEIDHVISRKHGGNDDLENLALACYLCNRYKGSDIASVHSVTGELVRLYHPRRDNWHDHFRIVGPVLEPLTDIGAVTAQLLRLNTAARVMERQLLQTLSRYPKA